MTTEDIEEIKKTARAELEQEKFRAAVELYKTKLRNKKPFWDKVFPWKIIVVRKEKL